MSERENAGEDGNAGAYECEENLELLELRNLKRNQA